MTHWPPTEGLVLASASPARSRLLQAAGLEFDVIVSGVDEDAVVAGHGPLTPAETAGILAAAKATDVARQLALRSDREEPVWVLGCDSVAEMAPGSPLAGVALGKPRDAADAAARIRQYRGNSAYLHTGHCLIRLDPRSAHPATARTEVASTTLHFAADLTDAEIDAYVASGEPLNVAGSFTLDGRSAPFIDRIDGDPSNVIGLSLPLLRRMLATERQAAENPIAENL